MKETISLGAYTNTATVKIPERNYSISPLPSSSAPAIHMGPENPIAILLKGILCGFKAIQVELAIKPKSPRQ